MKVLLINGSCHEHGCTDMALQVIAKELNSLDIATEIVWIGADPINDFVPGNMSVEHSKGDDMVKIIGEKTKTSDGFIFGSPTYYAHPTGRLLSFMDCLSKDYGPDMAFKPAAGIMSARRAGQVTGFDILNKHFAINSMPIVTSTYWNLVFGNRPEEVLQDQEGMCTMINLARNMAWLLKSIEAGKKLGIQVPSNPKQKTNFHR